MPTNCMDNDKKNIAKKNSFSLNLYRLKLLDFLFLYSNDDIIIELDTRYDKDNHIVNGLIFRLYYCNKSTYIPPGNKIIKTRSLSNLQHYKFFVLSIHWISLKSNRKKICFNSLHLHPGKRYCDLYWFGIIIY